MSSHPFVKQDGFSLLEVVTVLTLLSVLSVIVVGYFVASYQRSDTELISQTHILKTHIRYAQSRAMNTNTLWGVQYSSAQQAYWLFNDTNPSRKIAFPGQTAVSVDLDLDNMGLDITGADFILNFDSWGHPIITDRTFTAGELILNLNRGGSIGDDITITENTGFIP